jgi:hypothetical protein
MFRNSRARAMGHTPTAKRMIITGQLYQPELLFFWMGGGV